MKNIILGSVLTLLSASVIASPVSVRFNGILDEQADNGGPLSTPVAFSLLITYDTNTVLDSISGPNAVYLNSYSGSLQVGSTLASAISGNIIIGNDITNASFIGSPSFAVADSFSVNSLFSPAIVADGQSFSGFGILLADGDGTALTSEALPGDLGDVSGFEVNNILLGDIFDNVRYEGYVTNVAVVPIPAAGIFFFSALTGLFARRLWQSY